MELDRAMNSHRLLLLLTAPPQVVAGYRKGISGAFPDLPVEWIDDHSKIGPEQAGSTILFTFGPLMRDHVFATLGQLQWVQALGSGVDGILDQPSLRSDVIVTNGAGAQATPVSEAAIAFMFALARQVPKLVDNQHARTWERWPSKTLSERRVGIVGIGAIASALAPKCRALGMEVVGFSSSVRSVDGFASIAPIGELVQRAGELDFLVVLTPLTATTRKLIGRDVLAAMRPDAFLVNVARGGVVDEQALVEALEEGRIAGAACDVFEQEPLPSDHRLWSTKNLIVSPHLAGLNDRYVNDIMPLLHENLRRFLAGNADLLNLVRPAG